VSQTKELKKRYEAKNRSLLIMLGWPWVHCTRGGETRRHGQNTVGRERKEAARVQVMNMGEAALAAPKERANRWWRRDWPTEVRR
jgi:hypothetical protein